MRKLLCIAAALLSPLAAQAHMTWLLPNASLVTNRDGIVSVDAGVSEDLFVFERALKLEELRITGPAGLKLQPENRQAARHRESFDLTLPKEGTYRISNVSSALMGAYKVGSETKRFRSTMETLSKDLPAGAELTSLTRMSNRQQTFVSREEAGDASFAPEGDGLEVLPLGQVTDLSTGDTSRFRLLLDGKPVTDATVSLRRGGNRYRYKMGEISIRTDAKGEFSVQWSEPGEYWLGASVGARGPAQGGTLENPIERAALSVTLEVRPR